MPEIMEANYQMLNSYDEKKACLIVEYVIEVTGKRVEKSDSEGDQINKQ